MAACPGASFMQRVLLAIAVAANLFASESWLRLKTPDFDLYSSLNRKQASAVLEQLENAREIFEALQLWRSEAASPVRVIAFRSENEYSRYRTNDASEAYYLRAAGRNYIVIGDMGAGAPVVHEYVHLLLHQQYRRLPLWLDEGLAEVYSTATPESGGFRIGLPPDDRLEWLRMDSPAYDLPTLFSIRQSSFAAVKHLTPRSRFYAESWLLVHMLRFAPEYERQFQAFVEDVERGKPSKTALRDRYGKTLDAVTKDMDRYLKASQMPTELVHVADRQEPPRATIFEIGQREWLAVLSDLGSALGHAPETSTTRTE